MQAGLIPNEQLTQEQLKSRTEKLGKLKNIAAVIGAGVEGGSASASAAPAPTTKRARGAAARQAQQQAEAQAQAQAQAQQQQQQQMMMQQQQGMPPQPYMNGPPHMMQAPDGSMQPMMFGPDGQPQPPPHHFPGGPPPPHMMPPHPGFNPQQQPPPDWNRMSTIITCFKIDSTLKKNRIKNYKQIFLNLQYN